VSLRRLARNIRAALSILFLAAVAACSGSKGPPPAALVDLTSPKPVRVLWSHDVGDADKYIFSPAIVGDAIYATERDGTVTRIDARNGRKVWSAPSEKELSGGVGAGPRTVAVATEDGEVVALDAEKGTVRWRARVSSEVLAAPAVAEGLVLVRSIDSRVFAFGEDDGKRRWVYQRAPTSLMVRSPAGLTIDGDTAYAGFPGGKLAALALSNGGVRWEATVAVPKGATDLERVTDVVGDPAVQGREVCAAAYQGRVACYEAASGRQTWVRDLSSVTGVSLDARYAYVSDIKGAVHALDRTNGRSIWKQDKLSLRQLSMPLALGDAIAVGDFEGYVHFLARDSGAFLARYSTDGAAIRAAPVLLPSGGLLVETLDGGLYALAL
jgi:outer membrane protein assembly factor BamB